MTELIHNDILIIFFVAFILFLLWLLTDSGKRALEIFHLKRVGHNPVLAPHNLNDWETQAVFNPGAFVDDEGAVHLLYRAMGLDGLSRIGHAWSKNGYEFERKYPYPVYHPQRRYGLPEDVLVPKKFDPINYASGGGWGGCEDPRTTVLDDEVYMTYTAFEGWNNARITLTSIKMQDAKRGRWSWRRPIYLSPPNEMHKNWLLFPEKINGKFAILHGLSPKILVEYTDNLMVDKNIKSQPNHGGGRYKEPSRAGMWDERMRGASSPPIKTDLGWLVLYHGTSEEDPWKHGIGYRVGAMILDLNDPTKILYRSPAPILNPEMYYENDWKPGVVYASGAVVVNGELQVYYGGGDKYICMAHTKLSDLLDWLKEYGKI